MVCNNIDYPVIICPDCGQQCAIIFGNGWDYDLAFCPCGYEKELETITYFDYSF